jgi:hypothetical protein
MVRTVGNKIIYLKKIIIRNNLYSFGIFKPLNKKSRLRSADSDPYQKLRIQKTDRDRPRSRVKRSSVSTVPANVVVIMEFLNFVARRAVITENICCYIVECLLICYTTCYFVIMKYRF